jgi:hypothetical protein
MHSLKRIAAAFAFAAFACLPAAAQTEEAESAGNAPKTAEGEKAQQNYWGFGFGYVFNRIPVSLSTFDVAISDLWYSHIFGDPAEKIRLAGTLGFYGFAIALPVPKVSCDLYYGRPTEDIQFRGGIGGFYDVAVGGHGGMFGDMGVVIKNRVDLGFMVVPFGTDSKRSYSEFLGTETKEEAEETKKALGGHYVALPYYGVKIGLRF